MYGYYIPPEDGLYKFYSFGNCIGDFYWSNDGNPANKVTNYKYVHMIRLFIE